MKKPDAETEVWGSRILCLIFAAIFLFVSYQSYFVRVPPLLWPSAVTATIGFLFLVVAFLPGRLVTVITEVIFAAAD